MALLLILLLGVVAGSGVLNGSALVPEKCLQGPEIWCKDLVTAAECKRQEFCLALQSTPLWKELGQANHTLALAFAKKCSMCINVLQDLKDPDAINAAMRSVCKSFERHLRRFCRSLMKKFKDQIVNALQNNEDAQGACVDLKMCKSPPPGIPVGP